jgi:hypothetical protein
MLVAKRPEPGDVFGKNRFTSNPEEFQSGIHLDGIPDSLSQLAATWGFLKFIERRDHELIVGLEKEGRNVERIIVRTGLHHVGERTEGCHAPILRYARDGLSLCRLSASARRRKLPPLREWLSVGEKSPQEPDSAELEGAAERTGQRLLPGRNFRASSRKMNCRLKSRWKPKKRGLGKMTGKEIDAEILSLRREKKKRK